VASPSSEWTRPFGQSLSIDYLQNRIAIRPRRKGDRTNTDSPLREGAQNAVRCDPRVVAFPHFRNRGQMLGFEWPHEAYHRCSSYLEPEA
jgi:hypothetical protein